MGYFSLLILVLIDLERSARKYWVRDPGILTAKPLKNSWQGAQQLPEQA